MRNVSFEWYPCRIVGGQKLVSEGSHCNSKEHQDYLRTCFQEVNVLMSGSDIDINMTSVVSLGWDLKFMFHLILMIPLQLEEGMATYSHIPAWRIPLTEEPGGMLYTESHRVGHN